MNPELLRNAWLELNERRITVMAVIVGSVLLLAISSGSLSSAAATAELVFYGVVVFWGTRCAAQSVVEEIAGKTWDAQRLSAIRPWTMVWGKLLGSTLLAWIGGAMCLAVILFAAFSRKGVEGVLTEGLYYLAIGFLSQAVSMLASIVAVRRRLSHTRFDVFIYQLFGLGAAIAIWRVWQSVDPESMYRRWTGTLDPFTLPHISWWGANYDTGTFYIASLLVFAGWTLLANYRVMRTELQVRNGPSVWLAFLGFMAIYAGGFDPWKTSVLSSGAAFGLRMIQAGIALGVVTYVMALVEPKEIVAYRWLIHRLREGRLGAFLSRGPAWLYAYAATFIAGALALVLVPWGNMPQIGTRFDAAVLVIAALGFVLRDCGIFMAFGLGQTGKRSDIAALAVLAVAYIFAPGMFMRAGDVTVFFYPSLHDPVWLNPLLAWGQALFAWVLILRRRDLHVQPPT
jgi:hypothetical protein